MITVNEKEEIRRAHYIEGKSIRQIQREMGYHRETIRKALEGRLERLKFLYLEGDFGEAEYRRQRADVRAQLRAIRTPGEPAIIQASEYLDTLGELWDRATLAQKHKLLQGMIRKVRIDLQRDRVTCIEPHGEFVELFRQIKGLVEYEEGCFWHDEKAESAC
jgi:hypothetical protein